MEDCKETGNRQDEKDRKMDHDKLSEKVSGGKVITRKRRIGRMNGHIR